LNIRFWRRQLEKLQHLVRAGRNVALIHKAWRTCPPRRGPSGDRYHSAVHAAVAFNGLGSRQLLGSLAQIRLLVGKWNPGRSALISAGRGRAKAHWKRAHRGEVTRFSKNVRVHLSVGAVSRGCRRMNRGRRSRLPSVLRRKGLSRIPREQAQR
jgi:hypothetical protein